MITNYQVQKEDFEGLYRKWQRMTDELSWSSPFSWPPWLKAWWDAYEGEMKPCFLSFWEEDKLLGIAPLICDNHRAFFMGSEDVCDYQEFPICEGRESDFFSALLNHLERAKIKELVIPSLKAETLSLHYLPKIAQARGLEVDCQPKDVVLERELTPSWEDYLYVLNKKQRHELRRKLRRLDEAGTISFLWLDQFHQIVKNFDLFLDLFRKSNPEKQKFLTSGREAFFRSLLNNLGAEGYWRLGVLKLEGLVVSMTWCLDDQKVVYLYNSSYCPQYQHLSVGLMCKVLSIKESINQGRMKFSFLKGGELYKYRLGGKESLLYRLKVVLSK